MNGQSAPRIRPDPLSLYSLPHPFLLLACPLIQVSYHLTAIDLPGWECAVWERSGSNCANSG